MPTPLVIEIPHDLGRDEAKRRLEKGFGRIREQIGGKALAFEERWQGEQLQFIAGALGHRLSGRVDVFDKRVRIEVDLPWILAAVAERLKQRVRSAATLLLEKK